MHQFKRSNLFTNVPWAKAKELSFGAIARQNFFLPKHPTHDNNNQTRKFCLKNRKENYRSCTKGGRTQYGTSEKITCEKMMVRRKKSQK